MAAASSWGTRQQCSFLHAPRAPGELPWQHPPLQPGAEDPGEMKAHITVVQSPSSMGIYGQEPETCALRSAHAVLSDALLIFDEIGLCRVARGFIYLFWEREEGKRPGGMGNRERKREEKAKTRER